jgi:hypothetical protein
MQEELRRYQKDNAAACGLLSFMNFLAFISASSQSGIFSTFLG